MRCRVFVLTIAMLVPILTMSVTAYGQFGYGDIFVLDERTGEWIEDTDGDMAVVAKQRAGVPVFGNVGSISSITVSTVADIRDEKAATPGLKNNSAAAPALASSNTTVYTSADGIFRIIVTALPFDDPALTDIIWDEADEQFVLSHTGIPARWQFTYEVTNTSSARAMTWPHSSKEVQS